MRFQSKAAILSYLFLVSFFGAHAPAADEATAKVFVGYVSGAPRDINYGLYTHLCHAFITAEKDGTLIANEHVPSEQLIEEAHAAGVKVLLSLGGWGWDDNFAAMVLDPAAEDRYAEAVIRLIDESDYDGIDLDWEYPDTNIEIVGFERLTRRFRKALDGLEAKKNRPMLLTMAAAAHPRTLEWLSRDFLLETMDWVNVMTYDYSGGWDDAARHHAPLFSRDDDSESMSIERTMTYLLNEKKLPKNRLAVGLPLYGRAFAVAQPYNATVPGVSPPKHSYNYREIAKLQLNSSWEYQWNDTTKTPWLLAISRNEVICFDDVRSIKRKTVWTVEQGFRGVFFWQVDADRMSDGSNPLQEASHTTLMTAHE